MTQGKKFKVGDIIQFKTTETGKKNKYKIMKKEIYSCCIMNLDNSNQVWVYYRNIELVEEFKDIFNKLKRGENDGRILRKDG